MPMAIITARPAITQVATGTRSGMSSTLNEMPSVRSARGKRVARAPGTRTPRGPLGLALRLGQTVRHLAPAARLVGVGRRGEAAGQPQVGQQDDEGDDERREEQPDLRTQPGPEDAVEADAVVPDRVGPEVDARPGEEDDEGNHDDGGTKADATQDRCEPRRPGAVGRPTLGLGRGRAPGRGSGLGARPAAAVDRRRLAVAVAVGRALGCRGRRPPAPCRGRALCRRSRRPRTPCRRRNRGEACAPRPRRDGAPAPA